MPEEIVISRNVTSGFGRAVGDSEANLPKVHGLPAAMHFLAGWPWAKGPAAATVMNSLISSSPPPH